MPSGHAYAKAVRTVKTCVGTGLLPLRPRRRDRASASSSSARWRACYTPHKVKAAVTGCPRNCAEAYVKDIGARRRRGRLGDLRRRRGGRDRAQGRPARDGRRPPTRRCGVALAFLQHYREHGGVPRAHLRATSSASASSRSARPCSTPTAARAAASATAIAKAARRPRPVARAPRPVAPQAVRRAGLRGRRPGPRRAGRGAAMTRLGPVGAIDDVPLLEGRSDDGRRPPHRGLPRCPTAGRRSTPHCPHRGGPLADGIVADTLRHLPAARPALRPAQRRAARRDRAVAVHEVREHDGAPGCERSRRPAA